MKKYISIMLIIVLTLTSMALLNSCGGAKVKPPKMPKISNPLDKKRTVVAINNTGETVKEVTLLTDNGREVDSKTGPGKDFKFTLSKEYKEYDHFTVQMIDRYDSVYVVENVEVEDSGNTDIPVSEADQTENNKNLWDSLVGGNEE